MSVKFKGVSGGSEEFSLFSRMFLRRFTPSGFLGEFQGIFRVLGGFKTFRGNFEQFLGHLWGLFIGTFQEVLVAIQGVSESFGRFVRFQGVSRAFQAISRDFLEF